MSPDAILHVLLILWMVALGLLLARMFLLGLHKTYFLFTISTALDIIFGVATLKFGFASQGVENLSLLGDTMDVFLTPSVALELISLPVLRSAAPARFLSPVVFTLLAGAGINIFLAGSPDKESFEAAGALAFIADTMVTLLVISFLVRRLRQQDLAVERNPQWLRRLFLFQLVASAVHSLSALFVNQAAFSFVDIAFFSLSLVATVVCTLALRKPPPAAANA